jgi:hypothetical protein
MDDNCCVNEDFMQVQLRSNESGVADRAVIRQRRLQDLVSVGPAFLRDFEMLGVRSVEQLAHHNPEKLYEGLCRITGLAQDICCLDVFRAAVAQAKDPNLPVEQCQWWYWSRKRKARDARG